MFKIFSVVVFLSFSVLAHVSQEEINRLKNAYQELQVEAKRLGDRTKLFCAGPYHDEVDYIEHPKYVWQSKLDEDCKRIRTPKLVELRRQKDSLEKEAEELKNNSKEYKNYQMLVKQWEKLGLEVPLQEVELRMAIMKNPFPMPSIDSSHQLLAERIYATRIVWIETSDYDSVAQKWTEAKDKARELRNECKKHTDNPKIAKALEMIEFHNDNCTQSKDDYGKILPKLRIARDQYETALAHSKMGEHKQEHDKAVGSSTKAKGSR